jgi:hypothetical protein
VQLPTAPATAVFSETDREHVKDSDEDEINLPDSKLSTVKGLVYIVNYQKTPVVTS